jgi:phosphatidylserine synthase
MTIREYIKRQYWRGFAITLVGFFVVVQIVTRFAHSPNVIVLTGLIVIVGPLLLLRSIRCPSCRQRVGQVIGKRVALPLFSDPPQHCPFCAVSLDEQMPP